MLATCRRWARDNSGQAMVEFAVVILLFLVLLFGVIEYGWLFGTYVEISYLARGAARYAVVQPGLGEDDESDIRDWVKDHCYLADKLSNPSAYPEGVNVDLNVSGDTARVTIDYAAEPLTPFFETIMGETIPLRAQCTMRIET